MAEKYSLIKGRAFNVPKVHYKCGQSSGLISLLYLKKVLAHFPPVLLIKINKWPQIDLSRLLACWHFKL